MITYYAKAQSDKADLRFTGKAELDIYWPLFRINFAICVTHHKCHKVFNSLNKARHRALVAIYDCHKNLTLVLELKSAYIGKD